MSTNPVSNSDKIFKTEFDWEKNKEKGTKEKEKTTITMKEIVNCNAGNLKFGNKLLLYVKKGVWLNSAQVNEILKKPANLQKLNAISQQTTTMSYNEIDQWRNKGLTASSNAFEDSERFLAVAAALKKTEPGGAQEVEGVGENSPATRLQTMGEHVHTIAQLPTPESVVKGNSKLKDAFVTYLADNRNKYTINNQAAIKNAYSEFIKSVQEKSELLRLVDTADLIQDQLAATGLAYGITDVSNDLTNTEIEALQRIVTLRGNDELGA